MAWSDPTANLTFSVGEVVTAAKMNLIRDDLNDLDRRTSPTAGYVSTSESTSSASFTDLTTTGPAVTVTIGSTAKGLVAIYTRASNSSGNAGNDVGFAVSGAATIAAAAKFALEQPSANAGNASRLGATFLLQSGDSLAAGSCTFTMKYAASTGTATFSDRRIIVTPLGS